MVLNKKTRKFSKKNKTKKYKTISSRKKQFGGIRIEDENRYNRLASLLTQEPGTKVFIKNINPPRSVDVYYNSTGYRGFYYNNLIYTNGNPNPTLSRMTSLMKYGTLYPYIDNEFGVTKYRYDFPNQILGNYDFQNNMLKDMYFNRPLLHNSNNVFQNIPDAFPNAARPSISSPTWNFPGISSEYNDRTRYILIEYINPNSTTIDIMRCYTLNWDVHLNKYCYLTQTAYLEGISNGRIVPAPWGVHLNGPRIKCRQTGTDYIDVGDNDRLIREIRIKLAQMDFIFTVQGNRTLYLTEELPAGALSCFGSESAQSFDPPLGPFNAFNTILYRGQKTKLNFGSQHPDDTFRPRLPHAYLFQNYLSTHCGKFEDTKPVFWRTDDNSRANPGYIYELHLSPGIPYIAYDGWPFETGFYNENEILLDRGCIISTPDPDGEEVAMPDGGWVRKIICYVSYPNLEWMNHFIENGWDSPWVIAMQDNIQDLIQMELRVNKWDIDIGVGDEGTLHLGTHRHDVLPIEDAPESLKASLGVSSENNFEVPTFGGKKKRITNKKKSNSKRLFSKKR